MTTTLKETKQQAQEDTPEQPRNGRLMFYHPKGSGTGSAARFELRLNRVGERGYNCVFLELARQRENAPASNAGRQHAHFDWQNKITVKLGFSDLCEMVAVLDDRKDAAGDGQRGLYHVTPNANTIITFKKRPDAPGHLLGLSKKTNGAAEPVKACIVLSDMETLGLGYVLRAALFRLAFNESLG